MADPTERERKLEETNRVLLEALEEFRAFIRDGWGGAVRLQSSSLAADVYADMLFRKVDSAIAKARGEGL